MNNICPKYLQNYLTFTYEIYNKNVRSAESLVYKLVKPYVEIFRKTFAYSGADIWNSLPHEVKYAPSIKTFKSLSLLLCYLSARPRRLSERQTPGDLCDPTALTALLAFRQPADYFFNTPWERRPGVTALLQETKLTLLYL